MEEPFTKDCFNNKPFPFPRIGEASR
ncbi:uncharacterized protein G2W53_039910 [Senna tora]|uniref:Uncharacterized protein n=1 Tax=Senna tora TaxID=362788 RepID=A0A834T204_9FABA|nr:uncharacterized protein G2W53_039910 [Senna tora]